MNMSAQCDYMMISIIRIVEVPSIIADLRKFIDQWIIISKVFENVGRSPCVNLYVHCGVVTDNLML